LNDLFGVLADPGVFTDRAGFYNPVKHHEALLTVEQLFARVSSIQTSHRDCHAQRVLLFTVLDTLERLTGRSIDKNCSLPLAQKTLSQMRGQMPASAAEILLPAANRAVVALEEVQSGFFISSSPQAQGDSRRIAGLTPANAAARYIKVLRDATHGHGSNRAGNVEQTNTLLAHHDGSIPHDLPLIGYLYLLDLMTRPYDLRSRLYRNGHV
jgi:hypothetical protein